MTDLKDLAARFVIPGTFVEAGPLGSGHINETFVACFEHGAHRARYVFQRINRQVFPDPEAVMDNLQRILAHLHAALRAEGAPDDSRRALRLVPARSVEVFWRDGGGEIWRCFDYIESTHSFDIVQSPAQAREAAFAYGTFQRQLRDLPPPRLRETIPGFHDTPRRWRSLVAAVEADVANRAAGAKPEIELALQRESLCGALLARQAAGELSERIVHNDTKLNNVLLDEKTGKALCVIDLDTTMPGLSAWDFGDLVRSAAHRGAEDEADPGKAAVDRDLFAAMVEGWKSALGPDLSPQETAVLVLGAQVITLECGLRFLADYLAGDRYFRTSRPNQNLDRCRMHWALLRSLEQRAGELEEIASAPLRQ
ncbi:MAG TPA: aminoglycoside phosphotransferase family protein [Candidatus Polarisedimenticolia bacterium]|nr:aminoglycoside phosphotransferase family protein [Candidatus Polarisedimenticolia bacterium]